MVPAMQVFSCSFTEAGRQENVVLKVMDTPRSIHDSCRQVSLPEIPCLLGGCLRCHLAVMPVLLFVCNISQAYVYVGGGSANKVSSAERHARAGHDPPAFPLLRYWCASLLVSHDLDARKTWKALQVDIFSEIAVLERFKGKSGMCQLLDYGLDGDDFIMVLRHYSGSLRAWRDQMPSCPDGQLRLYLQIFCDIVSSVQVTASTGTSCTHV